MMKSNRLNAHRLFQFPPSRTLADFGVSKVCVLKSGPLPVIGQWVPLDSVARRLSGCLFTCPPSTTGTAFSLPEPRDVAPAHTVLPPLLGPFLKPAELALHCAKKN